MQVIWLADSRSPHVERWRNELETLGIEIKIVSLLKKRPRVLYLRDLIRVWFQIRREPATVIHAHFLSSYGVIASFLPSRFPKIVSIWGSDILLTPHKNLLYRWLTKRALAKADVRVTNSDYLEQAAMNLLKADYESIPFGLRLDKFSYVLPEFNLTGKQTFVIGVTKRLHKVAGIDKLLIEFASAVERLANINIELIVVGDGPETANLKNLCKELKITEKVKWTGWLSSKEVSAQYKKMHLAAFPSRVEGLGVAAIEAMASGVPVLGAKQGGLVELLGVDQQRGSLFNSNEGSLSSHIVDVVINYDAALLKAEVAREFVEAKFDLTKNVTQLE